MVSGNVLYIVRAYDKYKCSMKTSSNPPSRDVTSCVQFYGALVLQRYRKIERRHLVLILRFSRAITLLLLCATISMLYSDTYLLHIQGDSGGICINLGNDSMSDSKQKSSYEHGSDFERLLSYGHLLIPVHALM